MMTTSVGVGRHSSRARSVITLLCRRGGRVAHNAIALAVAHLPGGFGVLGLLGGILENQLSVGRLLRHVCRQSGKGSRRWRTLIVFISPDASFCLSRTDAAVAEAAMTANEKPRLLRIYQPASQYYVRTVVKVRGNAGKRRSWAPYNCWRAFPGPTQPLMVEAR